MIQLGVTRSRRGSARQDGVEMDGRDRHKMSATTQRKLGAAFVQKLLQQNTYL